MEISPKFGNFSIPFTPCRDGTIPVTGLESILVTLLMTLYLFVWLLIISFLVFRKFREQIVNLPATV